MKRWLLLVLLFAVPAEGGALRRYTYRPKDLSADPSARIPQLFVADAEADCPASGDLADADICYALSEDTLRVRAAGAWVALGGSVTLAGDVDGPSGSNDLDEANVESELEGVLDLQDQQGAVTDGQVPNNITVDLATVATTANAGDSATAFFPSGTLEDARVDGSAEADELVLAGDVDGAANAGDLDEAAVESELESVMDLADLQGDLALGTKTSGDYVASFSAGAGISGAASGEGSTPTLATASSEADFLASGALTCGAATQGKAQVHTTPLQYCDNAATPTLRYSAYGDTAGAALTGDSATAFFGAGAIEAARGGTGIDTSASTGMPIVTAGTWSVTTMPVTQITVCPPGLNAVANICNTFTDLPAAFQSAGIGTIRWADLATYTQYRMSVLMAGTGATTGDVVIQCDTVVNFASPTTLGTIDNPAASVVTCSTAATCSGSSWAAIGAGECLTAGGMYLRVGMINGNTTEDPIVRNVVLELR